MNGYPKAHPKDGAELARELVKAGNLTAFQAHQVLNGKVKALFLGNYTILDKIGAGGMGQVFKAEHRRMKRIVALKMLPAKTMKDAPAIARFQREVEAAAKLRHTNIVAADDADEANGNHFLVMEYVEGRDLSALVKKDGPFSVAKAVNYILQAARGLEFAHSEGVVHRDIKPANLLVDKKGVVKILDMGLARIETGGDAATQAELTGTGAIMGTVDYMAPEQGVSTKDADARADIYSLGCTLHFLLIGKPVYDGESVAAKLLAHHQKPIPSLRKLREEVPEQVDAVFKKMVAKKIEDRYQSMTEVIAAFQASSAGHDQSFTMQHSFGTTGENNAFTFLRELPAATTHKPKPTKKAAGLANEGGIKNKKPLLIGAGAAGFLVVLLGVIFIVKDKSGKEVGRIEVPEGGSVEVQATATKPTIVPKVASKGNSDKLWNTPAFQAWIKDVAALPAEKQVVAVSKKLVELNPGFDGKVTADGKGTPKIENGVVTQVWLFTEHVRDIAPLRALAGLKSLYCFPGGNASSPLSDLSPLHGMGLTALYLSGTRVSDLSHLRGLPLTTLQCNATPVFDLSPLEGLPLTSLNCGSSKVTDLSCLKGMRLKSLDCYNTQVSNLSPLRGIPLTQLNCGNTKISDLTPLQGMPLSTLIIDRTSVSDASPLQGMNLTTIALTPENITKGMEIIRQMKSLKTLGLHGDKDTFSPPEFWKKFDAGEFGKPVAATRTWESPAFQQWMRIVAAMPAEKQIEAVSKKLVELNPGFDGKVTPHIREGAVRGLVFASDALTDITPVRAVNELEVLNIPASDQGSEFSDLAQIARMRLRRLDIARTNVQDLALLVGMPLTELYCFRTGISTLTPLKGMALTRLHCEATNITDLSPIKGMPLVSLFCHNSKVSDLSPLLDCKDLKELNITLTKVTPAAVAALQKALPNCKIEWDDPKRIAKPWESPAFQQWVKDVQALPAEKQIEAVSKKLMELNPGFDGKVTGTEGKWAPKIESGAVTQLRAVSEHLTDISPIQALAKLTLLNVSVTSSKGLKSKLSDLSSLRGLRLTFLGCVGTEVSDLSALEGMPLTNLQCESTQVSDLSPLLDCKSLKYLTIAKTKVTPASVAALQKALPNCKIEWDDPAKATTTQPTTTIDPDRRAAEWVLSKGGEVTVKVAGKVSGQITATGDLPTKPFKVYKVSLYQCRQWDGKGIEVLQPLSGLRFLIMSQTHATDDVLVTVSKFSDLEELGLEYTRITDGGLAHLQSLQHLQRLKVAGTKITDQGLRNLEPMKSLVLVTFRGAAVVPVTPAGVAALQKALPNCKIEWDDPAKMKTAPAPSGMK